MKTFFARPIASERYQQVHWAGPCGESTEHRGKLVVDRLEELHPDPPAIDYSWHPSVCLDCGAKYDGAELRRSSGSRTIWDTPSGNLEPGALYWVEHLPHEECEDPGPMKCWDLKNSDLSMQSRGWHNCDGRHLYAVCPDGRHWDVSGRASNCTRPDDVLHRCWVSHGNPETETAIFTVDKNGDTCAAGAGSIDTGDYHGFLTNGAFT